MQYYDISIQVINKRFPTIFKFSSENSDFILAALSIPAIKSDFIEEDLDFTIAKQLLIEECKNYSDANTQHPIVETTSAPNIEYLVKYRSQRLRRTNSLETDLEADVTRYLAEDDKDYNLLNKYPLMKKIFFKYNTTLSSSAAVERVFSQSLMIFTPRRNRVSADHFEQTLFIKHNRKLLNNEKDEMNSNT